MPILSKPPERFIFANETIGFVRTFVAAIIVSKFVTGGLLIAASNNSSLQRTINPPELARMFQLKNMLACRDGYRCGSNCLTNAYSGGGTGGGAYLANGDSDRATDVFPDEALLAVAPIELPPRGRAEHPVHSVKAVSISNVNPIDRIVSS